MAKIISLKEARQLILASQRLTGPALKPIQIIEHLGYVQIDTISVIERAHHHTFWVRNPKYKPTDLDELVSSRKVFEYWSHAASFLPMKDYRYTLPMKINFRKNGWLPKDIKLMDYILRRIRSEGPLRSKDFKNTKKMKQVGGIANLQNRHLKDFSSKVNLRFPIVKAFKKFMTL